MRFHSPSSFACALLIAEAAVALDARDARACGGGGGCGFGGSGDDSTASPASFNGGAADAGSPDAGGPPPVQVVSQSVVGPYDVVTVRSSQGEALGTWLRDNGFDVPASLQPTIDA